MSFAEIEAALPKLSADELRRLAFKSWTVFLEREGDPESARQCSEDDPQLLAALDEATEKADATPGKGRSAREALDLLRAWTSK